MGIVFFFFKDEGSILKANVNVNMGKLFTKPDRHTVNKTRYLIFLSHHLFIHIVTFYHPDTGILGTFSKKNFGGGSTNAHSIIPSWILYALFLLGAPWVMDNYWGEIRVFLPVVTW